MISISEDRPLPSIRIEAGYAVIRIPMDEVHGLRVALAECPCKAPKSYATMNIRQRIVRALGSLPVPRR